jgi:hypothetical protein
LPDDSILAKRIVSWIALARRLLTPPELCVALAVQTKADAIDQEDMHDIEDIFSVCAGLVTIEQRHGKGTVRSVHYTTYDFLKHFLDECYPKARMEIAATCMMYLRFDMFRRETLTEDDIEGEHAPNGFLKYAAETGPIM